MKQWLLVTSHFVIFSDERLSRSLPARRHQCCSLCRFMCVAAIMGDSVCTIVIEHYCGNVAADIEALPNDTRDVRLPRLSAYISTKIMLRLTIAKSGMENKQRANHCLVCDQLEGNNAFLK